MMQLYQDSMAIVGKFVKPDLFITITCNPQWREIRENVLQNQNAADRPDIVGRVFALKVDCYIEFQKKGLPHIHLLIILKHNSKLLTADAVDRNLSAEILDSDMQPFFSGW